MSEVELRFPEGFLWGAATAAHQVEGDNTNADWWEWERRPGSPVVEPSGRAADHYHRYPQDVALLAELGFTTYRFSVEWARIEPADGAFDAEQLAHYRRMVDTVIAAGLTPMVTLNHFTLPRWVARRGGWLSRETPTWFERYCRRTVAALGDGVPWFCTVNEPGVVAFGGYLGALGFPPGLHALRPWQEAIRGLVEGHRRALAAVKELRPEARAGATHAMQDWDANQAGMPVLGFLRELNEDVFLQACREDDFIGVQTYTSQRIDLPPRLGPVVRAALRTRLGRTLLAQIIRSQTRARVGLGRRRSAPPGRITQMGYAFEPEALAATLRRAAALLPGKDLVVTEHGIATADDGERIEFIRRGLVAVNGLLEEGLPIRGYVHWSALDNFEWARGYQMAFGLIGIDRQTIGAHREAVRPLPRRGGARESAADERPAGMT